MSLLSICGNALYSICINITHFTLSFCRSCEHVVLWKCMLLLCLEKIFYFKEPGYFEKFMKWGVISNCLVVVGLKKKVIKHLSKPSEFDDQTNMRIVWRWHNILMGILNWQHTVQASQLAIPLMLNHGEVKKAKCKTWRPHQFNLIAFCIQLDALFDFRRIICALISANVFTEK